MVSTDSINSCTVMKLLLLLCLGRALGVARSDSARDDEVFGEKNVFLDKSHQNEGDIKMVERIESEMQSLNKSGNLPRDKRALGILLQGFMEALGYTVAPVQIASLPNPTPAAQMPVPAAPPPAAAPTGAVSQRQQAPPPMPPPMTNATTAATTPRQRETLRFTGVLNFGDHTNTSNLVSHLAQYEQIFHGIPVPSAPPTAPAPNIDPRSNGPLPEPLFVKIPLPIAPNLPPPQLPSPMPIKTTYHDEFTQKDHEEEYKGNKDDEGHHGDYEEEDDKTHHREEYGNEHEQYEGKHDKYNEKHEEEYSPADGKHDKDDDHEDKDEEYKEPENKLGKHDEPEDRVYESKESEGSYENNDPKNTEKEYKKNENIVKYSVENKEIHDPSEVSEEVPIVGSKYNHEMYVGEPDWKKEHEDHLYKLALEQEANAEALAEKNAERESDRSREYELDDEDIQFHEGREKEIRDKNDEHEARIEANSRENSKESYEGVTDHEVDYEQETKISEKPLNVSQSKEPVSEIPKEAEKITTAPASRRREDYSDESNGKRSKYNKNYEDYDEEKEKRRHYYETLPISYEREKTRKGHTLRDSYGETLEKPGGKVDERVAGYFTMFKNPQTGVYDPAIIQKYEKSHAPFDNSDLEKGFKRIQKEYGAPESKYEEYEINEEDDDKVEHRSKTKLQKPSSEDYQHDRSENESRKSTRKYYPEPRHTTECDCSTRNVEIQSEESKSPRKSVTTGLPPIRSPDTLTSHEPYYSTVKYRYEPRDYDEGIIARLTSYDQPTTRRFEDKTDLIFNPSHTTTERQKLNRPTEIGLPEKLTTKSLLHEAETKEIKAWPAPFDYVFDNSERSNVVVRGTTQTTLQSSNTQPTHQTTFETTKPRKNEAFTDSPTQFANKVQALLKEHENENITTRPRRPKSRGRKTKQNSRQSNRASNHPTLRTTQATIVEQRKRLSSIERPVSYRERSRTPTFAPLISETLTPHPERASVTKGSTENIRNPRRRDQSTRQSTKTKEVRAKPTVKRKFSEFPSITEGLSKEESSNYVERDGMLIIPEPTPYFYNERVDEFTDVPQSDTGKVKIKEYRNRIASVKVSELKQLHPVTPMRIVA